MKIRQKSREFIWGIYDFADTIFSMNVVSLYFPLLIVSDLGGKDIYVGLANSISQLLIVLTAPVFGIFSDRTGKRMPLFIISASLCAIGTLAIGFSAELGAILPVVIAFIFANYFYQLSLTFYNSLLPRVGPESRWGKISGLGTALGYVGSIVGMIFVMPFNTGKIFGLNTFIPAGGRIATFTPTAILFAIFALPTLIYYLRDERRSKYPVDTVNRHPFKKIWETFSDTRRYPGIRRFIVSRFFFEEGVETAIVFMGVFAEKAMGMPDSAKIVFFVIATTAAVFGSIIWGKITDWLGPHQSLMLVLYGWIIGLIVLAIFPYRWLFYPIGCWIGMMLGGVWTTSRPYLLKIAPAENVGRYFGLYSLSGKAAAITGPLIWGTIILIFGGWNLFAAYRIAVATLAILIAIGTIILMPNKILFEKHSIV